MTNIYWWLPSLTTAGLFSAVAWLFRKWIGERLAKSIQHEFDHKIEKVRTEFRVSEEVLKARLREREGEISALRSGALSVLASRRATLDNRRLEAVDQIWSAFRALAPARFLATNLGAINFETTAELAERDPKVRQFFETLGGGFDMSKLDIGAAEKARPYVTPMVWAVYSAIVAVTTHVTMRWIILKGGLGKRDFVDFSAIRALVVKVLPNYDAYLNEHGPAVYQHILQALEDRLLEELRSMMNGFEADRASLEQAAEILKASNEIQQSCLILNDAT